MAPSKKAKKEPAPAAGGGLAKFFGGSSKSTQPVPSNPVPEQPETPVEEKAKVAEQPQPAVEEKTAVASTPVPTSTPAQPVPTATVPEKGNSGGLTEAQKQRMEENRRKALERQQLKRKAEEQTVVASKPEPDSTPKAQAEVARTPTAGSGEVGKTKKGQSVLFGGASTSKKDSGAAGKRAPLAEVPKGKVVIDEDHVTPLKKSSSTKSNKDDSDISPEKTPSAADRRVLPATAQPGPQDKFATFGKHPWIQYNGLYSVRLEKLRAHVLAHAREKWSNEVPAAGFLPDVVANGMSSSSDVVIVGLIYRDLQGRDNIIEKYQNSQRPGCMPEDEGYSTACISTESDSIWIEDRMSRVQLQTSAEHLAKLSTGFVVGARGRYTESGKFQVKDICFAQSLSPSPVPVAKDKPTGPFVAFWSGLFIGAPDENVPARNCAVNFFLGKDKQSSLAEAIQRVIVCGGVYAEAAEGEVPPGITEADNMFSQLAEKLSVEVLPGRKDPTNLSMPQMPLHPYLFRTAKKSTNFKSVSNPYQCNVGELRLMGHSGQPTQDLLRCTSMKSPLEALATSLDACLLAPTAPDTLGTQPFSEDDPFIIEKVPQILFSGGHDQLEFEWRSSSNGGTLCMCVPAFHHKPVVVLVNLADPKDVRVQDFSTQVQ
jgi:DNA polymerase delta subunit 2